MFQIELHKSRTANRNITTQTINESILLVNVWLTKQHSGILFYSSIRGSKTFKTISAEGLSKSV